MKIEVEIKEISLGSKNLYASDSYDGDGFYKLNDGTFSIVNGGVVWPGVIFDYKEIKEDASNNIEQGVNKVTEDFALKMLSVVHNNQQIKDL